MKKLMERVSRITRNRKIKNEGGVLYSKTLREYTEQNYGVLVDLYTYGSCFEKSFNVGGKVSVGRYCSVATDVHYFGANHPISNLTTSAVFYNTKLSHLKVEDVERHSLSIGHDVWIGSKVIITAACSKIGNGAVIGAGSVVTHDVEPYTIVAGNPARVIRKRFPDDVIDKIEKTKWWNRSPQELMDYYEYMPDPALFCDIVCGNIQKEK